ncbi:MAG: hypothetical protein ACI8V2_002059 [Candidatus Latescibacterota bacterium]|jgi:hypothetical protein
MPFPLPRLIYLSVIFFFLPFTACSLGSSVSNIPTYTLTQKTFSVTVKAAGALEAKVSQAIMTPRTKNWRQIEIAYITPEGASVKKDDVVVQFDPQTFETERINALATLDMARADAQKKEAELTAERLILEANMASAKATAAISRLQVAKLEFVAPRLREIKRLEMQRNELKTSQISQRLAGIEAIQKEERAHVQIKIKQAENKLKQAEETIQKLTIKAPTDGIFVYQNGWRGVKPQEGNAMYPGEPIAKIPNLSVMQIKLQVGEIAAQKLKKDQRVEINISSLENAKIMGKISRVAKRAKPIQKGSKIKQVEVIAELDTTQANFTPGLSAEVCIFTGQEQNGLVAPLECVFQKDSLDVVYVKNGTTFESYPITLSEKNANFVIIEGNLTAGAQLALREPPSTP